MDTLPDSQNLAGYASDGSGSERPRLGHRGNRGAGQMRTCDILGAKQGSNMDASPSF
jgi:hypothetical protein